MEFWRTLLSQSNQKLFIQKNPLRNFFLNIQVSKINEFNWPNNQQVKSAKYPANCCLQKHFFINIYKSHFTKMQTKLSQFGITNKQPEQLPPGLTVELNYITQQQENQIILRLKDQPWSDDLKRKTIQYGFKYDYQTRQLIELPNKIPEWIRLGVSGEFDQLIVNNYEKGQGITKHTDHKTNFHNEIVIISLLSNCEMTFRKGKESAFTVKLPRRSKITLKDQVRYDWTHQISRVKQKRISLTFRRVWKDALKK